MQHREPASSRGNRVLGRIEIGDRGDFARSQRFLALEFTIGKRHLFLGFFDGGEFLAIVSAESRQVEPHRLELSRRLRDRDAIRLIVEPEENLARRHLGVFIYRNFFDGTGHFGGDRQTLGMDVGIVTRDGSAAPQIDEERKDDEQRRAAPEKAPPPAWRRGADSLGGDSGTVFTEDLG